MIFDKKLIPKNLHDYESLYKKSVSDPEKFWSNVADSFIWENKWSKVVDFDFSKPIFNWFTDAKLNITHNCLDRHVQTHPNKSAIIFEPNDPKESTQYITYKQLHNKVLIVRWLLSLDKN